MVVLTVGVGLLGLYEKAFLVMLDCIAFFSISLFIVMFYIEGNVWLRCRAKAK